MSYIIIIECAGAGGLQNITKTRRNNAFAHIIYVGTFIILYIIIILYIACILAIFITHYNVRMARRMGRKFWRRRPVPRPEPLSPPPQLVKKKICLLRARARGRWLVESETRRLVQQQVYT